MGDKSMRGRGLLRVGKAMRREAPKVEEMTANEKLGVMVTGGWRGKPHSTKEGREASGKRKITRFFYGRGKKKGVEV